MKTTKPLSKQSERQLLQATEELAALVSEDGLSPTEAAVKVARDHGFNRNFLTLCCQAYNVGATNHQREVGEGTLAKFANFPIADAEAAAAEIWPETPLTPNEIDKNGGVDAAYSRPYKPSSVLAKAAGAQGVLWRSKQLEKVAAVKTEPEPVPGADWVKFSEDRKTARAELEQVRTVSRYAQSALLTKLAELTNWFRPAIRQDKMAEVCLNVVAGRGEPGQSLVNMLKQRFPSPLAKQASYSTTRVDWSAEPYCLFDRALDATREVLSSRTAYLSKQAEFDKKFETPPWETKAALDFARPVAYGTGGALGRELYDSVAGGSGEAVQSMLGRLSDPAHEDEIRRIQVQAMLADVMQDPVLSGYDPVDVLSAYNELAQSGPRAAAQPALVTPMLRKRLAAGILEPFDIKDFADTEKSIATVTGRQPPTNSPRPGGSNVR